MTDRLTKHIENCKTVCRTSACTPSVNITTYIEGMMCVQEAITALERQAKPQAERGCDKDNMRCACCVFSDLSMHDEPCASCCDIDKPNEYHFKSRDISAEPKQAQEQLYVCPAAKTCGDRVRMTRGCVHGNNPHKKTDGCTGNVGSTNCPACVPYKAQGRGGDDRLFDTNVQNTLLIDALRAKIAKYESNVPQGWDDKKDYNELCRLATILNKKHFDNPSFSCCSTIAGVITQIDNMTCGWTRDIDDLRARIDDEKKRRVYYQGIVYDVMNSMGNGKMVCGTIGEPSTQVQDGVRLVLKRRNEFEQETMDLRARLAEVEKERDELKRQIQAGLTAQKSEVKP